MNRTKREIFYVCFMCVCVFLIGIPRIPDLLQQKYSQQPGLKDFTAKLAEDTEISGALRTFHAAQQRGNATPSVSTATVPTRTLASPEWQGDSPINVRKRLNLEEISMSQFESANVQL